MQSDNRKDEVLKEFAKFQKFNSILSFFFIFIILLFGFLIRNPTIIIILTLIIIIITYFEEKAEYCPRKYSKFIFLLSSTAILGALVFGLIPNFIPFINFQVQLIIFNISLYLILHVFAIKGYFLKENIILLQHILAVSTFFVIVYTFFPIIQFNYINFSTDPSVVLLSEILLHGVFISIISLGSFYYLFARHFYKKPWRNFNRCIIGNLLLIETFLFILINFRNFYLLDFDIFISSCILSLVLFPIVSISFIFLNYLIRIFPSKTSLVYTYYSLWFLISIIFLSIIFYYYVSIIVILFDLLYLSLVTHILLKFGFKINKIKENTVNNFSKVNSYFILILSCALLYSIFFNLFASLEIGSRVIISTYFSLISFAVVNYSVLRERITSRSITIIINEFSLLYTSFLTYYFFFINTFGTYYMLIIPILFSSIVFYLPIFYLRVKVNFIKIVKKLTILNSFVLSISVSLIPTIVGLELYYLGHPIGIITLLNYTLYILFGILLFIYILSKYITIRNKRINLILKSLTLIELILTFTTFFYYPYTILIGSTYALLFSAMIASIFLFLPILFSFKKKYFSEKLVKKIIILNSFFLWGCIVSLPTFIGLEFIDLGVIVNSTFILLVSIILFFLFLKYINLIFKFINFKESIIINTRIIQIITWYIISIFVILEFNLLFFVFSSNWINLFILSFSSLIFFLINIYNLYQLENLKQQVFEFKRSKYDYYRIYKIYEYNKNIIFFGIIFSLSFIISSFIQSFNLAGIIFPSNGQMFSLIFNLSIFLLISLLLFKLSNRIIEIEFNRVRTFVEFIIWLGLKSITILVLVMYPFQILILSRILLLVLAFSILFPITIFYAKNLTIILEKTQLLLKKIIGFLFYLSISVFFTDIFWNITKNVPYFYSNQQILISIIICILILFTNFYFSLFNNIIEQQSDFKIYRLYGVSVLLLFTFTYLNSFFSLLLLLLSYIIILSERNRNIYYRFVVYFLLSFLAYIELITLFISFSIIPDFFSVPLGFYICVYFLILISIFLLSILLNLKRINNVEKFSLYIFISSLSFVYFLTYTTILIIYNLTISIFIFLSLTGIFFYRLKDDRYKWFIRPCLLLLIFDFISILSYAVFFKNPPFTEFKSILSFTLTLFVTGFAFVFVYNKSPSVFRKRSFYIALTSNVISFPVFLYFFLVAALSLPIFDPIILTISINVAIFLFYLSVGIFQWKISWAIWKTGWLVWILFPLANFYIINRSFTGIDIYTNALTFFGVINIDGSFIVSFMICVLLSLPFWYTWIKKHFSYILFLVWGISLFLIYWFSQNIFTGNFLLTNILFIIFSVLLLFPLLYRLKYWKILSILWLISITIDIYFVTILLTEIGIPFEINISLNILIAGILFIILSFFPNLRAQKAVILIGSYFGAILGVFLLIFNILNSIILNTWVSVNLTFIVIGLSLFSSKLFKINQKIMNFIISLILTVNFSFLTFFTFSLIPGYLMFAIFFAITVCGGSLLVFDRFKMMHPIRKIIPLSLLSFGLSSTLSSLIFMVLPGMLFLISAVFAIVNLIFIYSMLEEYRFVMWYLIPIPVTLLVLQGLYVIELFQPLHHLILTGLMLYTIIFQFLINSFNTDTKKPEDFKTSSLRLFFEDKNQIKILNLICFTLNSTYFSIFVSIVSPFFIVYQILEFLIIWSILILLSFRYIKTSKMEIDIKNLASRIDKFSSIVAFFLYFEIYFLSYYLLTEFLSLGINESLLISFIILFILTFIDISLMKKVSKKIILPINITVYIILSLVLFFILNQFMTINPQLFLLNLIILLVMQFYTIYALFSFLNQLQKYDVNKLTKLRSQFQSSLLNVIFIIISLYIASIFSSLLPNLNILFEGLPSIVFFSMIFSFLMFLFNLSLKIKLKYKILLVFYLIFQISFLLFGFEVLFIFNYVNFFAISLILIIETILSYYPLFSIKKIFSEKINLEVVKKVYLILLFIIYLEFSFLFYGIFNLFFGLFESLLVSQIILFFLSLAEINVIKKMKEKYMGVVRTISYFNFTWSLFIVLFQFLQPRINMLIFVIMLFIFMQFYTNHSYYLSRKNFNVEKEISYKKWKNYRQKAIGTLFYFVLLYSFLQSLIQLEIQIPLLLLILAIVIHGLMLVDKYVLKFIGLFSNFFIIISLFLILGFSVLYFLSWISIFSVPIIPIIVIMILFELFYLFKMLEFWQFIKSNKVKIRKILITIFYLNIITWPLYFLQLDLIINLNLLLISALISLTFSIFDTVLKVFEEKLRKKIRSISLFIFSLLLSVDAFSYLELIIQPNFLLNLSISSLIFSIFMGILFNPFKRNRLISFLYWTLICFLLSFILYSIYSHGIGWALLIIGIILYPFIFMLEELKDLLIHFIDYLSVLYYKLKNALISAGYKIFNFLKAHFKIIRIILAILIGALSGYIASILLKGWLHPVHATLLSLAVVGFLLGIIPSKRAKDAEEKFQQEMKQFITVWISITGFIYALILPYIASILFGIILIIPPILGLGAIMLIFIYRKEKREKISIKWRFYTTSLSIALFVIWIILLIVFYFIEVSI